MKDVYRRHAFFVAAGAVALLVRVVLIVLRPAESPHDEMMSLGFNLGLYGELANPHHHLATGPSAHVAPLYPLFIAGLYRLTSSESLTREILRYAAAVAAAMTISLTGWFAATARIEERAARLSALVAVLPVYAWIETSGQWEAPMIALAMIVVMSVTLPGVRGEAATPRRAMLAGTAWGVAFHLGPTLLPPYLVLLAVACWKGPRETRARRIRFAVTSLVVTALVITPYTLWNRQRLGGLFFMRDNLGLELATSNAPNAKAAFLQNILPGGGADRHPNKNLAQARLLRSLGEVEYNRRRLHEAVDWIRTNPRRFAALSAERWIRFWAPWAHRWYQTWFSTLCVLGAVAGVLVLARSSQAVALALAGTVLSYSAVYAIIQGDARYSYPVLWLLEVLAAVAAWAALERAGLGSRFHV